jgi:C2 domain
MARPLTAISSPCSLLTTGRTETIWDVLNPSWVRSFTLPPTTQRSTLFRVFVYDRDAKTCELAKQEVIGSAMFSVQDILNEGSNGKHLKLENNKIKDAGTVTVIGELFDEKEADHEIFLGTCKFRNASLFGMLLSRPYLVIYRRRPSNEWAPIYRSKPIKKGEDAAFDEDILRRAKIRTYNRRGSCEETPLRIELRAHRSMYDHKLIGAVQMSLGSLRRQALGKKISLGLAGESVGELTITRAALADDSSSFDLEVSFCAK